MLVVKFFSSSKWWRSRSSLVTKPSVQGRSRRIWWTRAIVSGHNMRAQWLCIKLHNLASPLTALKIILIYIYIYIYLELWEKKPYTNNLYMLEKQIWKFEFHNSRSILFLSSSCQEFLLNLDRYYLSRYLSSFNEQHFFTCFLDRFVWLQY